MEVPRVGAELFCADGQTCRYADMQTCRHADMQTCRHTDIQTDIHDEANGRFCSFAKVIKIFSYF